MQRRGGIMDQQATLNGKKHPGKQSQLSRTNRTVPLFAQYHTDIDQKHFQKNILTFLQDTWNLHITAFLHDLTYLVKMSFWESISLQSSSPTSFTLWKYLQQLASRSQGLSQAEAEHCHSATETLNSYATECLWHGPFTAVWGIIVWIIPASISLKSEINQITVWSLRRKRKERFSF